MNEVLSNTGSTSSDVIDLTGSVRQIPEGISPALSAQTQQLAAEVEEAVDRLTPLLQVALRTLTEVDGQVCEFAAAEPSDAEQRYQLASGLSGHERLFDALQRLSASSDVYMATADQHTAAMSQLSIR